MSYGMALIKKTAHPNHSRKRRVYFNETQHQCWVFYGSIVPNFLLTLLMYLQLPLPHHSLKYGTALSPPDHSSSLLSALPTDTLGAPIPSPHYVQLRLSKTHIWSCHSTGLEDFKDFAWLLARSKHRAFWSSPSLPFVPFPPHPVTLWLLLGSPVIWAFF